MSRAAEPSNEKQSDGRSYSRPLRSRVLGTLGATMLKTLMCTYRWKLLGPLPPDLLTEEPKLFAFWHNQQLLISKLFWLSERVAHSRGVYGLASRHADGQIIAQAVECFGFRTEAGSTTRGGSEAVLALRKRVIDGYDCAITPDGPKGPAFVAKGGIVMLAKSCNVPIYPAAYGCAAGSAWEFSRAWDGMFLPKPRATVVWSVGPALRFDSESDTSAGATALTEALRQVNQIVGADTGISRGDPMILPERYRNRKSGVATR